MKKVMVTLEGAASKEKLQEIYDYWLPYYARQYQRMLNGTGCKSLKELVERIKKDPYTKENPEKRVRWDVWRYMPHQVKYGEEDNLLYGVTDEEMDTIFKKLIKKVAG